MKNLFISHSVFTPPGTRGRRQSRHTQTAHMFRQAGFLAYGSHAKAGTACTTAALHGAPAAFPGDVAPSDSETAAASAADPCWDSAWIFHSCFRWHRPSAYSDEFAQASHLLPYYPGFISPAPVVSVFSYVYAVIIPRKPALILYHVSEDDSTPSSPSSSGQYTQWQG